MPSVEGGVAIASDSGTIKSIRQREHRQRRLPAEIVDHRDAERREQELPERAGRGAGAERKAALLGRQQLAERRQHQVERTARQPEADQDAGAEIERQRRRRITHQKQTAGIEQRADDHHAQDAEAIGDGARDRLAQAPQQVLQRQREAEHVASPGEVAAHRLDEKAEARARPEAQQRDQASADDDDQRRPPGAKAGRWTDVAGRCCHVISPGPSAPGTARRNVTVS